MAEQMLCSWARWSPAAGREPAWDMDRTLDPPRTEVWLMGWRMQETQPDLALA